MRIAIALVVVAAAALAGGAAGHLMRPPPEDPPEPTVAAPPDGPVEAVPLREPFVVPVLRDGRIWSHVVLSLGVESRGITREAILAQEPRLRDGLNRTLWTYGSLGGFDGDFTALDAMGRLQERLDGVVSMLLDDPSARVLLIGMTRQSG
jgi:hypothetical protein